MADLTAPAYRLADAHIEPPTAMAGVRDTWRVTLSGLAVPEGGIVRLRLGGGRDNKSDWTRPQADDPAANEYVTASCSGAAELRVGAPAFEHVHDIVVDMTVVGAPLAAEDEIAVILGDTSGGGEGSSGGRFRYTKQVASGDTAVLEFETTVAGKYVNGVDIMRCDESGRIVEFRVMVRPLQAVDVLHEQMRAMLESMRPTD